jgi:hypothetical protein
MLQRQLNHLNGRKLDRRQVFSSYTFCSGFALSYAVHMLILLNLYGLCLLSAHLILYLRRATFWSALPLTLKFRRFRRWRAASASVLLGKYASPLFIALWFFGDLVRSGMVHALSTAFN